jgi:hypothetical protein
MSTQPTIAAVEVVPVAGHEVGSKQRPCLLY